MKEILVQLKGASGQDAEAVLAGIERAGGRASHVYPPLAIIAQMPPDKLEAISIMEGVAAVFTGKVSQAVCDRAPEPVKTVLEAWNHRVERRGNAPAEKSLGMAWDAPGRLPPDPPPEIMAEWRRRERESGGGD